MNKSKMVFITWTPNCTRSENQARHFGARLVAITYLNKEKSILLLLVRYTISFLSTLVVLFKNQPKVVFTENQPPFLILAVFMYYILSRNLYIIDSHSGAFHNKKWAWALPIYKFVAKRAFLNINTNQHHKSIVESWGGKSKIIGDIPIEHKYKYQTIDVEDKSIAVVLSYSYDEPIEEIWEAARLTPDVSYYLTGNSKLLPEKLRNSKPENIKLLGFLSKTEYFGLLSSVKGIMVLTTMDHTMQRGAFEALSLEQPIITSEWDLLKDSFGNAALYVDNSSSAIAESVTLLLDKYENFKKEAILQRKKRTENYETAKNEIYNDIEAAVGHKSRNN